MKYIRNTGTSLELVGISANEVVIVWKATEASAEVISVTAGVMMSLFDYQAQIVNNQAKADLFKKVSNVFMFMALGTAIGSVLARRKATKIVDEITVDVSPNSLFDSLPQNVKEVLIKIKDRKLNSISNFATDTLHNLNLNNPNLIHNFFNSLPADNILKDLFYHDFKDLIKKDDFANFLNDTDILSRWQQMVDLKVAERVNKDVLSNLSKTNAIVRYYSSSNTFLRNTLERFTFEKRWRFLDKMGDISPTNYSKFTNDSELIQKWFKYYDEAVLRDDFLSLGEDDMIKFLEDFGDDVDALQKFRGNSKLIKDWDEFLVELSIYRKNVNILENYRFLKNSDELNIEIFKGRNGKKLKNDAVPPYNHTHYVWESKGVHHKNGLQSSGVGGIGKIDPLSSKVDVGPSGLGYYKAKIKIWHTDFPPNGAWLTKNSKGGMSTFFPDSWTKQKLQQELAIAFDNKTFQGKNIWEGAMSDGIIVRFHIDNGIIKSAFPIL